VRELIIFFHNFVPTEELMLTTMPVCTVFALIDPVQLFL
jgi:hypothetical protein